MLKIIHVPNTILNRKVIPVKKIDDKLRKLVAEMEETLIAQDDPPGVGLAAPQVGKNLALFVIKPTSKSKTQVFINPKIIKTSTIDDRELKIDVEDRGSRIEQNPPSIIHPRHQPSTLHPPSSKSKKSESVKLEGCLSIPRIWGPVVRDKKILVEYQNLTGPVVRRWFRGLEATIIQHEIDHLKGILFTEKALQQNQPLYEEKEGELEKIVLQY